MFKAGLIYCSKILINYQHVNMYICYEHYDDSFVINIARSIEYFVGHPRLRVYVILFNAHAFCILLYRCIHRLLKLG
jgi:hypothetical protein